VLFVVVVVALGCADLADSHVVSSAECRAVWEPMWGDTVWSISGARLSSDNELLPKSFGDWGGDFYVLGLVLALNVAWPLLERRDKDSLGVRTAKTHPLVNEDIL